MHGESAAAREAIANPDPIEPDSSIPRPIAAERARVHGSLRNRRAGYVAAEYVNRGGEESRLDVRARKLSLAGRPGPVGEKKPVSRFKKSRTAGAC